MNQLARFEITRAQIADVVARFYHQVRQNDALGPVFNAHVDDWPSHEEKISKFWANAILLEREYHGNPMQIHMAAHGVKPEMFADWLALFDQVLFEELPPITADAWSTLAHRIGRGLRYGLESYQLPSDGPPIFS